MNLRKSLIVFVLASLLLGALLPAGNVHAQATQPPALVSPGLCRVKTDMELPFLGDVFINYHSRTQLPTYRHIPGGITPATIRLNGGVGNLQLSPAWKDFVERINGRNQTIINYLFHEDSGWQNSSVTGRVEELAFENQWLRVLRVSGNRAYVETFFVDQIQPTSGSVNDPRIQLFTIVTRDDHMIETPKGPAYIILIARRGEALWIPTNYLSCPSRLPRLVTVKVYSTLNIRSAPEIGDNRIGSYQNGAVVSILEIHTDPAGNIWGRSELGWIALRYGGILYTDWSL